MRKANREEWVPAFQRHLGLDHDQVMRLSETEFINQRDYLELEGIKPGEQPKVDEEKMEQLVLQRLRRQAKANPNSRGRAQPQRPQRRQLTEDQQRLLDEHVAVQREQDAEYQQVLAEARARENEVHEDPIEVRRRELREKAAQLPPEPADGIVLAVLLPTQKRITRKFDKSEKGENLKIWVAATEDIVNNFELQLPAGAVLDEEKTFDEQGIKNRSLFNVVMGK